MNNMDNFECQSILNLIKELPNDEACKAYLSKIKWSGGFICSKCGHDKGCEKSGYRYRSRIKIVRSLSARIFRRKIGSKQTLPNLLIKH